MLTWQDFSFLNRWRNSSVHLRIAHRLELGLILLHRLSFKLMLAWYILCDINMYILCRCFLQTLYTYPENWRAFKAQIAAQYSGARLKVASSPPAFTFGQTNRSPAFLNNFPLGKVGVLPVFC